MIGVVPPFPRITSVVHRNIHLPITNVSFYSRRLMPYGNKALIVQFVTVLLILSDASASVVAAEK